MRISPKTAGAHPCRDSKPSDLSLFFPLMHIKTSSPALLLPPAECVCFLAPHTLLSTDAVCFGSQASLGCRILRLAGTQTPPVPGIRIVSQSAD